MASCYSMKKFSSTVSLHMRRSLRHIRAFASLEKSATKHDRLTASTSSTDVSTIVKPQSTPVLVWGGGLQASTSRVIIQVCHRCPYVPIIASVLLQSVCYWPFLQLCNTFGLAAVATQSDEGTFRSLRMQATVLGFQLSDGQTV